MKDGDDEGVTTSNRKAIFLKMASVLTSESSMGDDEDEDDDREENEATSDVEMGQQPQQKPRKQQKGKHFGGDENCGRQDDSELVALDNTINTEHDENENDNGNENENDIEMGETTDTVDVTATTHNDNYNDIDNSQCHSISNQDHDQHSISTHLCVRIPCANGTRSVDAHCAICLGEYMTGDKVSFSNLECRHAFHYDCILPWLSKGKKRCPICRHWFVPGTKIDDQKKAAAAAAEAAALAAQPSSSSDDEEEIEIVDSTDRVAAAPTIIGGRTDESSQASLDQEEFDADQQQEQEEQRVDASPHDV
uniref:RING-type domain-containing protein n=1 Tax=Craspedostauros australis TaxID=1486917 RepID=A0A7R9WUC2_9STRA|mmetsp:Transcript_20425/g.56836  ORF Transcript_20425/g.56836 Transcript_20425/m.56836 type:complete len:308 (+) Transcript_20425:197-1120(+)